MDTVESVCKEVEKLLVDINAKGGGDEGINASLEKLSAAAETLGMKSGKQLIDNLSTALREGKTGNSLEVRIIALDFYNKNVLNGQGNVEDI
jgi:hypothetical protein